MKTLFVLAALSASSMFGGALTIGTWEEFSFGAVGSFGATCGGGCTATTNPVADQTVDAPWTFSGPATLQVLDLFVSGDQFAVFDNSVLLANTSAPGNAGACGNDITCALGDTADYSYLSVALGAGAHSITIQVIQNAVGTSGGAAVLSASAGGVPEPGTLALLAGGLGLLGFRRWRKA